MFWKDCPCVNSASPMVEDDLAFVFVLKDDDDDVWVIMGKVHINTRR